MRFLVLICAMILCQLAVAVGGAGGATATCVGEQATIVGTSRADVLRGTPRKDVIVGLAGNDTIVGLGGPDIVCGGGGNDTLDGGRGNDGLDGGRGNDRIVAGDGNDFAIGGFGNDELIGGAGDENCLAGGPGSDRLVGGPGIDCLVGETGADRLVLGDGDDFGFGGAGDDALIGGVGNDRLHGDDGDDDVAGGAGNDFCVGEQKTSCEPAAAGGDLAAGTYLFDGFDPNITLTVGDGWWSEAELSFPEFVQIAQGPSYLPRFVNFSHVPEQVRDFATGEFVPLEGDFLAWLTSQDCIDVSAGPSPATVAGVSGMSVDFTVGTEPPCSERFEDWWPGFFLPGERDRLFVIEVNGVELIIDIATWDPTQFDAFLPEAEAVLNTVHFG